MFSPLSLFATMVCASLSLYGKRGTTALMKASEGGHTAIVELLLGAGADKDAKDKVRETKRAKELNTHMWMTRWFEGGNTVWPLFPSLELRLVPHVAWGLA